MPEETEAIEDADRGATGDAAGWPPSDEDLDRLVPRPGSPVWRLAGDARLLAGAGAALVMQVAHPTVAAGVREHSNFAADPWGRLLRTLDFTNALIYGGAGPACEAAARVRESHVHINGTAPDGRRYHARDPDAYAWVHATLADSIVASRETFVGRLEPDEVERFWAEWRGVGRLLGVAATALPETWRGFLDYRDEMAAGRLTDNDVVREVLATLHAPAPPPLPKPAVWAWPLARIPIARVMSLATVGLLPPLVRERLALSWGWQRGFELAAVAAASRAATPLLPGALRAFGTTYRGLR